jgi:putative SOS response-associated peptidase YedK
MCGRFAFYSAHESIVRLFGVADVPEVEPHWNIAPTQFVATVREQARGDRRLTMLYWGLVPYWAQGRTIGARMINARCETLKEKAAFREAYRRRRCLVLADGYYEWQRAAGVKQPWFIHLASGEPFGRPARILHDRDDPARRIDHAPARPHAGHHSTRGACRVARS